MQETIVNSSDADYMPKNHSDDDALLLLTGLGISPHCIGFAYLAYGITLVASSRRAYYADGINILSCIMEEFHISKPYAVSRMKHVISASWHKADNTRLRELFPALGAYVPPSPSEFICRAAIILQSGGHAQ